MLCTAPRLSAKQVHISLPAVSALFSYSGADNAALLLKFKQLATYLARLINFKANFSHLHAATSHNMNPERDINQGFTDASRPY